MKKIILILLIGLLFLGSCGSKSGKVGSVDAEDITYFKDSRTNLCYAIIGAKKGMNFIDESESIGMACVPCENIPLTLLKQ